MDKNAVFGKLLHVERSRSRRLTNTPADGIPVHAGSDPKLKIGETAMVPETRKTGIDVVGDMPWGTHFCLFYETKRDLLDTMSSYCKAGLESEEFCLWVVAEPLTIEEAIDALKDVVPRIDRYLADSSIEIVSARDWYLEGGTFDLKRVTGRWHEKLAHASARGYAGVRG